MKNEEGLCLQDYSTKLFLRSRESKTGKPNLPQREKQSSRKEQKKKPMLLRRLRLNLMLFQKDLMKRIEKHLKQQRLQKLK